MHSTLALILYKLTQKQFTLYATLPIAMRCTIYYYYYYKPILSHC